MPPPDFSYLFFFLLIQLFFFWVSTIIIIVAIIVNMAYLSWRNRVKKRPGVRTKLLEKYVADKGEHDGGMSAWIELGDRHPDFVYTLWNVFFSGKLDDKFVLVKNWVFINMWFFDRGSYYSSSRQLFSCCAIWYSKKNWTNCWISGISDMAELQHFSFHFASTIYKLAQ